MLAFVATALASFILMNRKHEDHMPQWSIFTPSQKTQFHCAEVQAIHYSSDSKCTSWHDRLWNPPPPKSCPVLFSLMFNKKRPYVSLWRKERRTLVYCLGKIKMTNYFVSQLPIRTQKLQVLIQSPEACLSESPQTRVTMMGKSRITDQFNTGTNKLTVKSDRHKWPNTSSLPTLLTELHLNWVCGVVASPPPF